ncbi:hypothetical protein D3C81_1198640 [compost metagenome]
MSERKYPHLTNGQLIKLLGCVRIMNHKNYPPEFDKLEVPYGHDLIDTIVQRLHGDNNTGLVKVDLNFLFRNNHDLETYITASLTDFREMTTGGMVEADRLDDTVVGEVLRYIEEYHLVMKAADYKLTLFFARDVRTHGLTPCGEAPDWSITMLPIKGDHYAG